MVLKGTDLIIPSLQPSNHQGWPGESRQNQRSPLEEHWSHEDWQGIHPDGQSAGQGPGGVNVRSVNGEMWRPQGSGS
jgi:hypothetical protein